MVLLFPDFWINHEESSAEIRNSKRSSSTILSCYDEILHVNVNCNITRCLTDQKGHPKICFQHFAKQFSYRGDATSQSTLPIRSQNKQKNPCKRAVSKGAGTSLSICACSILASEPTATLQQPPTNHQPATKQQPLQRKGCRGPLRRRANER